ncbi:hypothetical protein GGX14DRAFT_408092 [Mycena pura]|uniref:Deoxyribonuclease NucA/NucB domain-containing protein n=1 Tax=Mycena pura TaxID=153505 RepID=A0AAD6UNJ5_9AGAR|nr:hypothetical protein GGX14DRAFT_408092 [Mycena pura]
MHHDLDSIWYLKPKPPPVKPPPKSVPPPPPPKSVPPPPPPKSVTPPPPKSSVVPPPPKSSAPPPRPKSSAPPAKPSQPISSLPPRSSAPASSKPIPLVNIQPEWAPNSSHAVYVRCRVLSSSSPMSSVLPASSPVLSSAVSAVSSVASSASQSLPGSISAPASSAQSSAPSSVVSPASSVITSAASSGSLVPSSSASVLGSAVSSGSADPLASSASGSAVSSSAASVITSAASSGSQSASVSVSDLVSALSSDAASSVPASSVCALRASGVSGRSSPQGSDSDVGDCSYGDLNDDSYEFSIGDIGDDTLDPIDPDNPPPSDRELRPRRNWLLEGDLPTDPKSCEQNPDNCDNGGSGNCVLTEHVFDFNPSGPETPPPGTPPWQAPDRRSRFRFIRGNATYKFLPGESMIARQLSPGANKELIFNCNEADTASLPDVCNNMCYGLNCLQINNEFKRETNTQQCAANRRKNACAAVVPNACSSKFKGAGGKASLRTERLSCDEFPFASTDVATAMTNNDQIATRCVYAKHNSRQGGKIGGFYRYVLGAGKSFEVKFDYGNANGAQGSNDGPAGSATMGYCKAGVEKGNGQTCDKDNMQMN